jgi:hypothetical protein
MPKAASPSIRPITQACTPKRTRPLMSLTEAAAEIGVSRSAAYAWARAGCLPGLVELNGRWYVRRRVLLAWLDGQEMGTDCASGQNVATADPRGRKEVVHPA